MRVSTVNRKWFYLLTVFPTSVDALSREERLKIFVATCWNQLSHKLRFNPGEPVWPLRLTLQICLQNYLATFIVERG
jgi:hypothetical protein